MFLRGQLAACIHVEGNLAGASHLPPTYLAINGLEKIVEGLDSTVLLFVFQTHSYYPIYFYVGCVFCMSIMQLNYGGAACHAAQSRLSFRLECGS